MCNKEAKSEGILKGHLRSLSLNDYCFALSHRRLVSNLIHKNQSQADISDKNQHELRQRYETNNTLFRLFRKYWKSNAISVPRQCQQQAQKRFILSSIKFFYFQLFLFPFSLIIPAVLVCQYEFSILPSPRKLRRYTEYPLAFTTVSYTLFSAVYANSSSYVSSLAS